MHRDTDRSRLHGCPLCGNRFTEGGARCTGCPIHGVCATICCPRCGYQFVERSVVVEAMQGFRAGARRWLGRWRRR